MKQIIDCIHCSYKQPELVASDGGGKQIILLCHLWINEPFATLYIKPSYERGFESWNL